MYVYVRYEQDKRSTTERELARLRLFVQEQHRELQERGDSSLRAACFDDETTRRLDSFRLGSADVQRSHVNEEELSPLLKGLRSTLVTAVSQLIVLSIQGVSFVLVLTVGGFHMLPCDILQLRPQGEVDLGLWRRMAYTPYYFILNIAADFAFF